MYQPKEEHRESLIHDEPDLSVIKKINMSIGGHMDCSFVTN